MGKRWVDKRDHSEMRPRMVESGCGCTSLETGRGAGCRGEVRRGSGLRVGGWKRENVGKGEWRSKGNENREMRMRVACKVVQAQGACPEAGAKCASKGRETAFGEEDGVVGRARRLALADHLHRGEQRWTLDERPLIERETVRDRNGNNSNKCTTRHCDPSHTAVTNNLLLETLHLHRRTNRWAAPKSHRVLLSSLFDGLEVLDPRQSCIKQAGESSSRCFYKAKVMGCHSTNRPPVGKSTYLSRLALRGKLGLGDLCRENAEA